tara:strand:- start:5400 stop:5720 length:321 start_codon:yes stop_codon:yes gene_type:complete
VRNEGVHQEEMKETLSLIFSNTKSLFKSIKALAKLLIKDIFKKVNESKSIQPPLNNQNIKYLHRESGIASQKPSLDFPEQEETDSALNGFSPEIINLIEEEDEKIA